MQKYIIREVLEYWFQEKLIHQTYNIAFSITVALVIGKRNVMQIWSGLNTLE
jgi:hypothetical protein